MAFIKQKRCPNCHNFFTPDYRNGERQKFCNLPECKKASKSESQKRWFSKNPDYFKGVEHVQRVLEWRRANPGYRKGAAKMSVLQDNCQPKSSQKQDVAVQIPPVAKCSSPVLQDIWITQHPVFIGLIAHFTGFVLQEDIAAAALRLTQLGQDVINGATSTLKGGTNNETQAPNLSQPHSNNPRTVQLAGSPPGT
jgi:hypothetical protein